MEFIIWGAGYRGKVLYNKISSTKVNAFIDSDINKLGSSLYGKPIIDLETYKKEYPHCMIIVSVARGTEEIEKILQENQIYSYELVSDMPSEFCGYGDADLVKEVKKIYPQQNYILYGFSAYSFILADELSKNANVEFLDIKDSKRDFIDKYYLNKYKYVKPESLSNNNEKKDIFITTNASKEKIETLKKSYNVIDLFDLSESIVFYKNFKLLELRNKYSYKKRCFIVATGPSLTTEDLDLLKMHNEFCISVNTIFKYKGRWKPDVYVFTDRFGLSEHEECIKKYDVPIKILNRCNEAFWKNYDYENVYSVTVINCRSEDGSHKFDEDIYKRIYAGNSVTYACLETAMFLGFKEIYLLGVDCNYQINSSNNHFIKDDYIDTRKHTAIPMIEAFYSAREYANSHGIKIYNATRGGMLEVFPRVDFDSLFEEK